MRIETLSHALVHWTSDGWHTVNDTEVKDSGLGVFYADLPTENLKENDEIVFTFYWTDAKKWENNNFYVQIKD